MNSTRVLAGLLLGIAGACAALPVVAAGLPAGTVVQPGTTLPAVSGVNGKWEFDPGLLTGGDLLRGADSVSVPLGERVGLQGDAMAGWSTNHSWVYGAAAHVFTRDPAHYLVGVTGGFIAVPTAKVGALGIETELYTGQLSFEGWAGVAKLDYVNPAMLDKTGVFALGDLGYYATPDLRLTLGGSYVLGDLAAHAGAEYLLHGSGTPLALKADARLHSNGGYTVTVGLKGYLGGSDTDKSLIDRNRQDDPSNKAVDLLDATGNQIYDTPVITADQTPTTNNTTTPPVDDTPFDQPSCRAWAATHDPSHQGLYVWGGTPPSCHFNS